MATYSIWVLEYSYIAKHPVGSCVYGAFNEGFLKLPFCYVLIKGDGVRALINVGYNEDEHGKTLTENFGVKNWRAPEVVLAECGVRPEDITDVFITHAHFDHMGGTDLFPNATFYLQEKELTRWVWAMSLDKRFRWMMSATDPADIMRMVDLARNKRLVCVDGAREDVLPGIDLHPVYDSHTPASQYVMIRNDRQRDSEDAWIFAGDLIYRFENLTGGNNSDPYYIPVGLASGSQTNLLLGTDEMLRRVGGETRRVIPVHEERLKDHFPSRLAKSGLRITEIALASGETSRAS